MKPLLSQLENLPTLSRSYRCENVPNFDETDLNIYMLDHSISIQRMSRKIEKYLFTMLLCSNAARIEKFPPLSFQK